MTWGRTAVAVGLALTVAVGGEAHADTATWASTFPIQTGAEERVAVAGDGSAWAVIDHSRVLKSTDNGVSWVPVNPVPVGPVLSGPTSGGSSDTKVAPLSAQAALGANGNAVSMTTDGGLSWQKVTVPAVTSPPGYEGAQLLRRTAGRFWLAPGGFDVINGCAVVTRTTPLLSSSDSRRWARTDLPIPGGLVQSVDFADARHGAVAVVEFDYQVMHSGGLCGYSGAGRDTVVFVTADGGRSWRRAQVCTSVCHLAWAQAGRLVVGSLNGTITESRDSGRSFRQQAVLPTLPDILGLQDLDCAGSRCWALVNGTGIYRADGPGEWIHESSDADVAGICVASIAAGDHDHAFAAGPHALMTRVAAPVVRATGAPQDATKKRITLSPYLTVDLQGRYYVKVG